MYVYINAGDVEQIVGEAMCITVGIAINMRWWSQDKLRGETDMRRQGIISRLQMIFTKEELSRMRVEDINEIDVTVDVHGMHCKEVMRFLNNIINLIRESFILTVIHGYNRGIAIKHMLYVDMNNRKIKKIVGDYCNMGITYINIAR